MCCQTIRPRSSLTITIKISYSATIVAKNAAFRFPSSPDILHVETPADDEPIDMPAGEITAVVEEIGKAPEFGNSNARTVGMILDHAKYFFEREERDEHLDGLPKRRTSTVSSRAKWTPEEEAEIHSLIKFSTKPTPKTSNKPVN